TGPFRFSAARASWISSLRHSASLSGCAGSGDGQFQRFTDSRWKFTGTVKVWDDVYDANLDFQRPMDEQTATRFLAELKNYGATNFDIKMYGEAPIELSGTGDKL
ncbi:hypothetical protein JTL66_34355, partial [Pseudomonas aeruginosa]|nr:hypothetical protein [Pseudomonas aeruginosa]